MPYVEATKEIASNPDDIYVIAKNMESYPNFMKNVVKVTTLERGENYTVTKWDVTLKGKPLTWKERDEFDDSSRLIDFKQIEGDLKMFEGSWTFEPTANGTMVKVTTEFELGLPMFATLLNPIAVLTLKQNFVSMLDGLKEQAEGK